MGEFIALAGLPGTNSGKTENALQAFAAANQGSFRPLEGSSDDDNILIIDETPSGTTVFLPSNFMRWEEVSQFMSMYLKAPVFIFHIHDGDLWMFVLYANGEVVDQFNTIPDYWDDGMSDEEIESWAGNAEVICKHIPGVKVESIRNYLEPYDFEAEEGKAYPDDEFMRSDCWQMCDFLKRLGLRYPIDGTGKIQGKTFEFLIKDPK